MRPDPDQLAALAAVVAEGTFDAAAHRLHVTPSAVSQRIKALETQVGRVLVRRSKPVSPTPSGEALLRLARQLQSLTADTLREIGADARVTVVPLAVNADSLDTWLLPALAGAGPGIALDLRRDDQTRTADQLRQGTVMAAITTLSQPVSGCSVHRLGRMRYRVCASPEFARRWFPDGPTVEALASAPVVVYDRSDLLQDRYLRRRTRRRLDPPRHHVPGSHAFAEGVRLGLGWGMLPDEQTGLPDAAGDRFVDLDPSRSVDVTLYWQQWRLQSAALDAVAELVRSAAARLR
ncbi:LysR family transcriptional regulator ArgP [Jatrophihabitans fulvus]